MCKWWRAYGNLGRVHLPLIQVAIVVTQNQNKKRGCHISLVGGRGNDSQRCLPNHGLGRREDERESVGVGSSES